MAGERQTAPQGRSRSPATRHVDEKRERLAVVVSK
jgi:hypothetical protein